MALSIRFNEDKNQLLKATRGIGFDEAVKHLKNGDLLAEKIHPDKARSHQRLYIVKIESYAYVVPFVINEKKDEIFLKTIYPSRSYTKLYIKEGEN
jgi:hypothetical protein